MSYNMGWPNKRARGFRSRGWRSGNRGNRGALMGSPRFPITPNNQRGFPGGGYRFVTPHYIERGGTPPYSFGGPRSRRALLATPTNFKPPDRPPSPLPGTEEYMQRDISEKSAVLKKALELDGETDCLNINSSEFDCKNGDFASDSIRNNFFDNPFLRNSNTTYILDAIQNDLTYKQTENISSLPKRGRRTNQYKKPESLSIEQIHNRIIEHISSLSYSKKMSLINQSGNSCYDVALEEIAKQKRLELSRALRDMCNDQYKQFTESGAVINSIIPDFDIKIDELPKELVEQLSLTLNEDFEKNAVGTNVDPEIMFQQAADMLNIPMDAENRLENNLCESGVNFNNSTHNSCIALHEFSNSSGDQHQILTNKELPQSYSDSFKFPYSIGYSETVSPYLNNYFQPTLNNSLIGQGTFPIQSSSNFLNNSGYDYVGSKEHDFNSSVIKNVLPQNNVYFNVNEIKDTFNDSLANENDGTSHAVTICASNSSTQESELLAEAAELEACLRYTDKNVLALNNSQEINYTTNQTSAENSYTKILCKNINKADIEGNNLIQMKTCIETDSNTVEKQDLLKVVIPTSIESASNNLFVSQDNTVNLSNKLDPPEDHSIHLTDVQNKTYYSKENNSNVNKRQSEGTVCTPPTEIESSHSFSSNKNTKSESCEKRLSPERQRSRSSESNKSETASVNSNKLIRTNRPAKVSRERKGKRSNSNNNVEFQRYEAQKYMDYPYRKRLSHEKDSFEKSGREKSYEKYRENIDSPDFQYPEAQRRSKHYPEHENSYYRKEYHLDNSTHEHHGDYRLKISRSHSPDYKRHHEVPFRRNHKNKKSKRKSFKKCKRHERFESDSESSPFLSSPKEILKQKFDDSPEIKAHTRSLKERLQILNKVKGTSSQNETENFDESIKIKTEPISSKSSRESSIEKTKIKDDVTKATSALEGAKHETVNENLMCEEKNENKTEENPTSQKQAEDRIDQIVSPSQYGDSNQQVRVWRSPGEKKFMMEQVTLTEPNTSKNEVLSLPSEVDINLENQADPVNSESVKTEPVTQDELKPKDSPCRSRSTSTSKDTTELLHSTEVSSTSDAANQSKTSPTKSQASKDDSSETLKSELPTAEDSEKASNKSSSHAKSKSSSKKTKSSTSKMEKSKNKSVSVQATTSTTIVSTQTPTPKSKNVHIQTMSEEKKHTHSVAVQTMPVTFSNYLEVPDRSETQDKSSRKILRPLRRKETIQRMFDIDKEIERLTKLRQNLYNKLHSDSDSDHNETVRASSTSTKRSSVSTSKSGQKKKIDEGKDKLKKKKLEDTTELKKKVKKEDTKEKKEDAKEKKEDAKEKKEEAKEKKEEAKEKKEDAKEKNEDTKEKSAASKEIEITGTKVEANEKDLNKTTKKDHRIKSRRSKEQHVPQQSNLVSSENENRSNQSKKTKQIKNEVSEETHGNDHKTKIVESSKKRHRKSRKASSQKSSRIDAPKIEIKTEKEDEAIQIHVPVEEIQTTGELKQTQDEDNFVLIGFKPEVIQKMEQIQKQSKQKLGGSTVKKNLKLPDKKDDELFKHKQKRKRRYPFSGTKTNYTSKRRKSVSSDSSAKNAGSLVKISSEKVDVQTSTVAKTSETIVHDTFVNVTRYSLSQLENMRISLLKNKGKETLDIDTNNQEECHNKEEVEQNVVEPIKQEEKQEEQNLCTESQLEISKPCEDISSETAPLEDNSNSSPEINNQTLPEPNLNDLPSTDTISESSMQEVDCNNFEIIDEDDDYQMDFKGFTGAILVIKVIAATALAASDKGKVFCFNMLNGELVKILDISTLPITSMCIVQKKDVSVAYTGSLDSCIAAIDFDSKEILKYVKVPEAVQCMEYSWGSIYVGSDKGSLIRYDLSSGRVENIAKISDFNVLVIRATREGPRKILLIAARNEPVCIRDASSGLLLRTMQTPFSPTVYTLLFNKSLVYCGTSQHDILVYTFEDGQLIFKHEATKSKGVVCMQIIGNLLFAGCYNGNIYIYNTKTNVHLGTMSGPGGLMLSMEIVRNKIIVGTKSSNFRAWRIPQNYLDQM